MAHVKENNVRQTMRRILVGFALSAGLSLAAYGPANASERQKCLNDCTQAGATQQKQCQADYDKEMIRCAQLGSNQERNNCKRQANEVLKKCNLDAREQVKKCKADCPPKDKKR